MGQGSKPTIPDYSSTIATTPYAKAVVNEQGNSYILNNFLTAMSSGVEQTLPSLYNQLLNPSLDSAYNKVKMNTFSNQMQTSSNQQFANNINALSQRGLSRSGATNDALNKLSQYQSSQLGSYADSVIANNTSETTSLIDTLLNQYMLGANLGSSALSSALTNNQQTNNYNTWQYQQKLSQYQNQQATISKAIQTAATIIGSIYGGPAGGAAAGAVAGAATKKLQKE